jgi:hypothetical protein
LLAATARAATVRVATVRVATVRAATVPVATVRVATVRVATVPVATVRVATVRVATVTGPMGLATICAPRQLPMQQHSVTTATQEKPCEQGSVAEMPHRLVECWSLSRGVVLHLLARSKKRLQSCSVAARWDCPCAPSECLQR